MESESWNRHEGSSRVESNEASVWFVSANVKILSVNLDVVELHTEHVLKVDVVPMDVSLELRLVEVAESQIGLDTILLLILDRGEIERENVAIKKFLYIISSNTGVTPLSASAG